MRDSAKTGNAVSRAADLLTGKDKIGRSDSGAGQPAVDRRPYSELPDRSKKWPRPIRVLFIAGSAAALWGLIFLAIRML